MHDPVEHPRHYTFGGVEVIDAIEAWDMPYHLGNAIKYIARHEHKGGIEDLKKARWYLTRYIGLKEKDEGEAPPEGRLVPQIPIPEKMPQVIWAKDVDDMIRYYRWDDEGKAYTRVEEEGSYRWDGEVKAYVKADEEETREYDDGA